MRTLDVANAFQSAAVNFSAKAKDSGADLIGHAHALYHGHTRMSATQVHLEIEHLRDAMLTLNAAFTRLDLAHAAMTIGETASRIRAAAEA